MFAREGKVCVVSLRGAIGGTRRTCGTVGRVTRAKGPILFMKAGGRTRRTVGRRTREYKVFCIGRE